MLCYILELTAQSLNGGISTGIGLDSPEIDPISISIGAEYLPPNAFFSPEVNLQYTNKPGLILIPLSINVFIGRHVKPIVFGGIVPF